MCLCRESYDISVVKTKFFYVKRGAVVLNMFQQMVPDEQASVFAVLVYFKKLLIADWLNF